MIARTLEEKGIATVTLNMFIDIAKLVRPPRTINTKFVFGAPFGDPNNDKLQKKVLEKSLTALKEVEKPGEIRRLPYKWREIISG